MTKNRRIKVLILGGSGFIGSNLIRKLSETSDFEITATYHNNAKSDSNIQVDWKQINLLKDDIGQLLHGKDVVVCAAGINSNSSGLQFVDIAYMAETIQMNLNLINHLKRVKIPKVITLGSSIVYQSSISGQREDNLNLNLAPHPNYSWIAWTKIYVEKLWESLQQKNSASITHLRLTNVFGPQDKLEISKAHVLAATIMKSLDAGSAIKMHGSGSEVRDLVYVDEVCRAISMIIQSNLDGFRVYNVGSEVGISVAELVELILAKVKKRIPVEFLNPLNMDSSFSFVSDCAQIRNDLGWSNATDFSESLEKTIDWYQLHYKC